MAIHAYAGSLLLPPVGTTGDVVVTGIVNRDNVAFTPKVVIFFMSPDGYMDSGGSQFVSTNYGFDDGTTAVSSCAHGQWQFGALIRSAGQAPSYSILRSVGLFTPHLITTAKITAMGSGTFTVTVNLNNLGLSDDRTVGFYALGGDEVSFAVGAVNISSAPTFAVTGVGFQPTGLVVMPCGSPQGAFDDVAGTPALGFVGTDLAQVVASALPEHLSDPVNATRYQVSGRCAVTLVPATMSITNEASIASFDPDGFTVTTGSPFGMGYLAITGPDVFVGSFLQPTTDGRVVVALPNIRPDALLLASVGGPTSTVVETDFANWSIGAHDGTRGRGYWSNYLTGGTNAGNAGQTYGGTQPIWFAIPAGAQSSDSTPVGHIDGVSFTATGFRTTWSECDGTARQVVYLAFGSSSFNPGTALPMRCQRRFGHVNASGKYLFCSWFQVDMQTGVGNANAPDPQIMLRVSKDGGHTWSAERWASAGKVGEYTRRVVFRQLGRARDWAFEITCSDPVVLGFMQAWADFQEGTS